MAGSYPTRSKPKTVGKFSEMLMDFIEVHPDLGSASVVFTGDPVKPVLVKVTSNDQKALLQQCFPLADDVFEVRRVEYNVSTEVEIQPLCLGASVHLI